MISFRAIWTFLGRPSLSVCLIYLIVADILVGSFIMRDNPKIFAVLDSITIQEWVVTYGLNNLKATWWFFVCLYLLLSLGITTSVCSINKVISVIKRFYGNGFLKLALKLSPSVIHLGFLFLLLGQLASHTLGVNSHGHILDVGGSMIVPGSDIVVVLKDLRIDFFKGDREFLGMEGEAKTVSGTLSIYDRHEDHEKRISMNHPMMYKGWGLFIQDFSPKSEGNKRPPYINMTLRRDPGIRLMIAGGVMFGLGLVLYLISVIQSRINGGQVFYGMPVKHYEGSQRSKTINRRPGMPHLLMVSYLFVLLFGGCSTDFEQYGEFSIKSLENGSKEITDGIGRKVLLVPRTDTAKNTDKEGKAIRIPVQKVVVYSGYDAALIKELGRLDSVRGVIASEERWHIPEIREGIKDGSISYLGEYKSIDFERLRAIQPDVVFTWDEGVIPKLEELSIPCVLTSTRIAKDLDAHIKFIEFLSVFYVEEKRAASFVDVQFKKINEISVRLENAMTRPKLVWGDIYERKVLVEPGNSWAGQLVEKAGGDYLFRDLEGASCMQVTLEKFFARTKWAEMFITYRGPESGITSKERLRQANRLLEAVEIKPMNEGRIFFTGYKLYQTADVAGIIEELAAIFHPGLFPEKTDPHYFFELPRK